MSDLSKHDPLCPIARKPRNPTLICECWIIVEARADQDAQSRADERERIAEAIEAERDTAAEMRDVNAESDLARAIWEADVQSYEIAARIARNGGTLP